VASTKSTCTRKFWLEQHRSTALSTSGCRKKHGRRWSIIMPSCARSLPPNSLRHGQHDQAVLSSYSADIPIITCGDEKGLRRIKSHKSLDCHDQTTSEKRSHHRFTLFTMENGQQTACKLEISHTLIDGMSVPVLFRDLATTYRGRLAIKKSSEPYFGDYVAWLARQITCDSVKYWR